MTRPPSERDMLRASDKEFRVVELRLIGAFFAAGTVKGAADLVGMGEQTVKNVLMAARNRNQVADNHELVRRYWKALTKHAAIRTEFGLSQRTLRYHFDEEYRERAKKQARDGMRKKRKVENSWLGEHYDRLIVTQGNICAVCGLAEGARRNKEGNPIRLSVDHDHETGQIRELLCSGCNLMLGCAKDDPARLEAGAAYLRRHAQATQHNKTSEAA